MSPHDHLYFPDADETIDPPTKEESRAAPEEQPREPQLTPGGLPAGPDPYSFTAVPRRPVAQGSRRARRRWKRWVLLCALIAVVSYYAKDPVWILSVAAMLIVLNMLGLAVMLAGALFGRTDVKLVKIFSCKTIARCSAKGVRIEIGWFPYGGFVQLSHVGRRRYFFSLVSDTLVCWLVGAAIFGPIAAGRDFLQGVLVFLRGPFFPSSEALPSLRAFTHEILEGSLSIACGELAIAMAIVNALWKTPRLVACVPSCGQRLGKLWLLVTALLSCAWLVLLAIVLFGG